MFKYIILFLFFVTSISASPFIDGVWNGKPWNKAHLLAEVEKGDPDALAEWASCSDNVRIGIAHDRELINERFELAVEGGSLLAKAFYGNFLARNADEKLKARGLQMMEEALKEGHPLALSGMARRKMFGHDTEVDLEGAHKLLKEAETHNSALAIAILGFYYQYDEKNNTRYDIEKSIAYRKQSLLKFDNPFAAVNLNSMLENRSLERFHHLIDLDTLDQGDQAIEKAAQLGLPFALVTVAKAYYDAKKPHLALPMMVRAANLEHATARSYLSIWFDRGYKVKSGKGEKLVAKASYLESIKFAGLSYRSGDQSSAAIRNYARYLYSEKNDTPDQLKLNHEKAEDLLLTKLNFNEHTSYDCNCHDALAAGLIRIHGADEKPLDEALVARSFAHYIYHHDHTPSNIYTICWYMLNDKDHKFYDPVKGLAAATSFLEIADSKSKSVKPARNLIKRSKKFITAEQKALAVELVADGYPTSEKYRREAYEYLLKIGDISPEHKFRAKR